MIFKLQEKTELGRNNLPKKITQKGFVGMKPRKQAEAKKKKTLSAGYGIRRWPLHKKCS